MVLREKHLVYISWAGHNRQTARDLEDMISPEAAAVEPESQSEPARLWAKLRQNYRLVSKPRGCLPP